MSVVHKYIHKIVMREYIYIYLYIYIYANLLSTSIHGYQKKKKKQKNKNPPPPSGTRDKNISNHRPREKRKDVIGQKERKGQPRHTSRKNQEMCSQMVKRKLKPVVNAAILQLQECSTRVEPITKLT